MILRNDGGLIGVEVLEVKNKKSGKCHELPRKYKKFKTRWGGGGGGWGRVEVLGGQKKNWKCHELPRKVFF